MSYQRGDEPELDAHEDEDDLYNEDPQYNEDPLTPTEEAAEAAAKAKRMAAGQRDYRRHCLVVEARRAFNGNPDTTLEGWLNGLSRDLYDPDDPWDIEPERAFQRIVEERRVRAEYDAEQAAKRVAERAVKDLRAAQIATEATQAITQAGMRPPTMTGQEAAAYAREKMAERARAGSRKAGRSEPAARTAPAVDAEEAEVGRKPRKRARRRVLPADSDYSSGMTVAIDAARGLGLSGTSLAIWLHLLRHAGKDPRRHLQLAYSVIGAELGGWDRQQVQRGLRRLIAMGLVVVREPGRMGTKDHPEASSPRYYIPFPTAKRVDEWRVRAAGLPR